MQADHLDHKSIVLEKAAVIYQYFFSGLASFTRFLLGVMIPTNELQFVALSLVVKTREKRAARLTSPFNIVEENITIECINYAKLRFCC